LINKKIAILWSPHGVQHTHYRNINIENILFFLFSESLNSQRYTTKYNLGCLLVHDKNFKRNVELWSPWGSVKYTEKGLSRVDEDVVDLMAVDGDEGRKNVDNVAVGCDMPEGLGNRDDIPEGLENDDVAPEGLGKGDDEPAGDVFQAVVRCWETLNDDRESYISWVTFTGVAKGMNKQIPLKLILLLQKSIPGDRLSERSKLISWKFMNHIEGFLRVF
jgi:hypothetical protein